jgi:hypothetical protein
MDTPAVWDGLLEVDEGLVGVQGVGLP